MKKTERFSKEQDRLSKCVRSLIALYYDVIDTGGLVDKSAEKYIMQMIGDIHDGKCKASTIKGFYVTIYQTKQNTKDGTSSTMFSRSVKREHIEDFLDNFEDFVEVMKRREFYHFLMVGTADNIRVALDRYNEIYLPEDSEEEVEFITPYKGEVGQVTSLMDRAARKLYSLRVSDIKMKNDKFLASLTRDRLYKIGPTSEYGAKLAGCRSMDDEIFVPSIEKAVFETSFDVMWRLILIHFHLQFDNYERLKICNYCNRLYFEKKKDAKKYCGSLCRKKASDAKEDEEHRKCRNRQKAWFRNKLIHVSINPVLKSECALCDNVLGSGQCTIMLERNRDELKKYKHKKICF